MEKSAPSPTKKAKLNNNDIDALEKLIQEGIEKATSREEAEELHFVLNKLANVANNKKFELMKGSDDFRDGCLVELIDSNQSQDQDLGHNMCSRAISAKFTAGPNQTPFSIDISVVDYEGEDNITISSELFEAQKEESDHELDFGEISNEDVDAFLVNAGFGLKPLTRITADGKDRDVTVLRRFAYAEIMNEAFGLIGEKHGWEDGCGLGLGIGNEEIYGLMGLDY